MSPNPGPGVSLSHTFPPCSLPIPNFHSLHQPCAGERPQRAKHLWRWMYYKDHWVRDLEDTHGKQYGFGADFRCSIKS